jgi:hypothetical protein
MDYVCRCACICTYLHTRSLHIFKCTRFSSFRTSPYIYIYAYTHTYMHAIHTHVHTYAHTHSCIYMYSIIHVHTSQILISYICMTAYTYAWLHIHMHDCIYICMTAYTYAWLHIYRLKVKVILERLMRKLSYEEVLGATPLEHHSLIIYIHKQVKRAKSHKVRTYIDMYMYIIT